jgi:hypothetical protein
MDLYVERCWLSYPAHHEGSMVIGQHYSRRAGGVREWAVGPGEKSWTCSELNREYDRSVLLSAIGLYGTV